MNTYTKRYTQLLAVTVVAVIGFLAFSLLAPSVAAKDLSKQSVRTTITIGIPEGNEVSKAGKLETRQSGERSAVRLKITPVKTEDGHIRVIVPASDLSEGVNIISVPARLMDSRDGETGGKLQNR